jgi:hypothetical protein
MNKKGTMAGVIGIIIVGLSVLGCSSLINSTGPGSETVALSGKIIDSLGRPATLTQVILLPASYNPITGASFPLLQTCTTDTAGNYTVEVPDSGLLNIQAVSSQNLTRLLIRNIHAGNDNISVRTDTLRMPGTIRIRIPAGLDEINGYFYIPGTTIYSWLRDNNGYVLLNSVPAYVNLSVYYAVFGSSVKPYAIADSVSVTPGGITNIEYVGWNFSKKLMLNTTATGANINVNVIDLPVLVRLTNSNFDFAQAKKGGEDLRFTKSDGSPLPYEVERWDSAGNLADIWVKVDTVYGNDSTHFLKMYWGTSTGSVTSLSSSNAIFDTARGFLGVWHLQEAANTVAGGYRDATLDGLNLTGVGTIPSVIGVIGMSRSFDSSSVCYLTGTAPSRLNGNVSFSVSFWVKTGPMRTANIQQNRVDIMDFGKYSNKELVHFFLWPDYKTQFGFVNYDTSSSEFQNKFDFSTYAGTWSFVTTVYNAGSRLLATYINGNLQASDTGSGVNFTGTGGIRIGKPFFAGDANFAGELDEVRILGVPLSADRIKLEYETQMPGSRLIQMQ